MPLTSRLSCLFVASLPMLLAVPAAAQSFNCHKAFFADERTICEKPPLGRLDSELAKLFDQVNSQLPPPQRDALKREETRWVVARRRCGDNGRCIAGFYRRRIQKLDALLAANEPEGVGRPSTQMTSQERRRASGKRKPPAVASTAAPSRAANQPSANQPSAMPASGSAMPEPSRYFDIEPEGPPAGPGSAGGSADETTQTR